MLLAFFFNFTILLSIFGYSSFFKKYLLPNNKNLLNIDFFFGLFLIYFLSITLNFFFKLTYFVWPVYLIGLIFFSIFFFKIKYEINFISLSIIVFIFTFVAFTNNNNIDSPMYHLQILKWIETEKIIFGLANIEIRFAMNSSWHSLISLLNINFYSFNSKYYLAPLLLSILINEIFVQKKINVYSYYFLLITILYLLFYNLFHPFKNGIIFNHLGNPESDIASMVFFFFSIYLLIKYQENRNDIVYAQLLFILIFFSVTSRLTNVPLIILGLFILLKNKKNFSKLNFLLISISSLLWLVRNFILSGCFIFPVKQTCLNTEWTIRSEDILKHKNEVLSWSRGHVTGNHDNYSFTIETNEWLIPWIKNYFFQDALLQIFLIFISLIIVILIFLKLLKYKSYKLSSFDLILFITFLLVFYIWFIAPEIRYGWGPIISYPAFLFYLLLKKFDLAKKFFKNNLITNLLLVVFVFGIFLKSFKFFDKNNLLAINKKNFDYSRIEKIKDVDGFEIYKSQNWQCADFKKICVNTIKKDYRFDKKFSYLIISAN